MLSTNVNGTVWLMLFSLFTKNDKKMKLDQLRISGRFAVVDVLKYCLILLGGTAVLSFLTDLVLAGVDALAGKEIFGTENVISVFDGVPVLLSILCVVIIAPITEELLFRKVLLENLFVLGKRKAVIASGTLFGILHFNPEQILYTIFGGIVYAVIVVKTGKVRNAVCLHMILNFFGGIVLPIVT